MQSMKAVTRIEAEEARGDGQTIPGSVIAARIIAFNETAWRLWEQPGEDEDGFERPGWPRDEAYLPPRSAKDVAIVRMTAAEFARVKADAEAGRVAKWTRTIAKSHRRCSRCGMQKESHCFVGDDNYCHPCRSAVNWRSTHRIALATPLLFPGAVDN